LGRFEFRRWIDGELKVEQEKWAKDKVRKALSDTRRRQSALPPRLPTEQPVSMHLHSFLTKPYREELAYHHFEGLSPLDCVRDPLPPPDDIPKAPDDGLVSWTYTESNRVYLGDFSRVDVVPETHKSFLGELMERDDITVLCEGLLLGLSTSGRKQFLEYVGQAFGNDPHHKFRRFERQDKDGVISYHECEGYVSMHIAEFLKYLDILYEEPGAADSFTLTNAKGKLETIAVEDTKKHVFYMIDVDMPKNLVQLNDEYKQNFKVRFRSSSGHDGSCCRLTRYLFPD
jgi:hypothetical protein